MPPKCFVLQTLLSTFTAKLNAMPRLLIFSALFMFACGSDSPSTNSDQTPVQAPPSKASNQHFDGPGVDMPVMSFSTEPNKIKVELRNGSEKAIRDVRGFFYFTDSMGNELSFANGNPKRSPFQRVENPHIVAAKSKRVMTMGNRIEKGATAVYAVVTAVEYTDGERETFE